MLDQIGSSEATLTLVKDGEHSLTSKEDLERISVLVAEMVSLNTA